MATKKWTAVDYDAGRALQNETGNLERVKLPAKMALQVIVELDEELYKALAKNPTWLQKLQQEASSEARDAIKSAAKLLKEADDKAEGMREQETEALKKKTQDSIEKMFEKASDDMAEATGKLIEDYKKGQKDLSDFRYRTMGKMLVTAITVSAGILISVATAGGLSIVGVGSIVRGAIATCEDLAKLALNADQEAVIVQNELKVLKKVLGDGVKEASTSGKIAKGTKEIGLNLISKALGISSPSLKNCEAHIDLHQINIAKLEKESKKLSENVYDAMDKQEKWAKNFDAAKKLLPAQTVGKVRTSGDKAEKELDAVLKSVIKVNESVNRAEERQKQFEKALEALKEGVPDWVKWVDVAISLAADIATGVHDASTALEKAAAGISALDQALADEALGIK